MSSGTLTIHPAMTRSGITNNAMEFVEPDEAAEAASLFGQIRVLFGTMWQLKLLTVFVPITLIARLGGMNSGLQFAAAFLSLIPLAGMLGDFTEDVVKRSNEVIGALINVTFGNATELIISFFALKAGQLELIKFSLVGSILGNMLLVLGTALLVGGLRFPILNFSSDATN